MNVADLSPEVILVLLGAIVVGVVLIRLGRQIAIFLLVAGGLGVVAIIALAVLNQAQATRRSAEAAAVASTGQTASSVGVTVLGTLLAVVVVAGGLVIAYQAWRLRRARRRATRQHRQWRPGPNALWGQEGQLHGYQVPVERRLAPPPGYPPTHYPPYPPMGYPPPPSYPGGGYQPVVVIYDDGAGLDEDPLEMLPLWAGDDDGEEW